MQSSQLLNHPEADEFYLSAADILLNATRLVPALRAMSPTIEEERRLPLNVVQMLRDAGVFRAANPKAWGGPEMTSIEQTRLVEIISTGDSAAGWCFMIGMDSSIYSGFLPEPIARKVHHSFHPREWNAFF